MASNTTRKVSKVGNTTTPSRHEKSLIQSDILYQANSIAYLEFDLKLNQLRILTAIIKNLQKELKERFHVLGKYRRKELPPISAKITVPVADFHFGKNNSGRLRRCLDETGSTFFSSYEYPPYATKVTLNLKDSFLNLLSKEEGYHRYSFALATSIKNKYTLRLYWLISVWRVRGGFVLQEDALKRILGLSKAYDKFSNIIGRVLEPARLDLKSRFPIWFEYQVTAREVEHCIIFQVRVRITDEERSHLLTESREVISHLLNSVGIRPSALQSQLSQLEPEDIRLFVDKLQDLVLFLREHPEIGDRTAYLRTSLRHWFTDWMVRYGPQPSFFIPNPSTRF